MGVPTIIIVEIMGSSIPLVDLGVTIPASGIVTLSDTYTTAELQASTYLRTAVESDRARINDGITTLDKDESLQFLEQVASIADLQNVASVSNDGYMSSAQATKLSNINPEPLAVTQARRTTTLTMPTTWTDVAYNVTDVEVDPTVIEHDPTNTDRILIKEAGTYEIKYQFEVSPTTTGAFSGRVRINDATVVPGSTQSSTTYSGESDVISVTTAVQLAAGDYVTVQNQLATSGTMAVNATFSVLRLEGTQGPAGSGSTLTMQSAGIPLPNTPHSTLNVTGGGATFVDSGSGVVTLNIPTPAGTDVQLFDINETTGGQIIGDTVAPIQFDISEDVNTSTATFSWDGIDEVTILRAGNINVSAGLTIQQTAGNGRTITRLSLDHQPSAGVYSEKTARRLYTRNSSDGAFGSMQLVKAIVVGAGDKIRVQGQRVDGAGTIAVLGGETNLNIQWSP